MYAFCMLPVIMRNRARHYEEQCPELWGGKCLRVLGKNTQRLGVNWATPWGKFLGVTCDFS